MLNTCTHLAGQPMVLNGRLIQRCCWCGFKLVDSHVNSEERHTEYGDTANRCFHVGQWVRVKDRNGELLTVAPVGMLKPGITVDPPRDFCLELVEEYIEGGKML